MLYAPLPWAGTRKPLPRGSGATLADVAARMTAQEARTQFLTVDGNTANGGNLYITKANLHIRNGKGRTDVYGVESGNGLGNVIVGYNEIPANGSQRSGSHCLVVGRYQSYVGEGGLVAGESNDMNTGYATVSGGAFNTANSLYSTVSGGIYNTANEQYATVSGGSTRTASGIYDWVAGSLSSEY